MRQAYDKIPRVIVYAFAIGLALFGVAILGALLWKGFEGSPFAYLARARADIRLHDAFLNTIELCLLSCSIQVLLTGIVTLYVQRIPSAVKLLLIFPFATGLVAPSFSVYVFLSFALGPIKTGLLGSPVGIKSAVIFIDTWQWTGILLLVCFLRLERLPTTHVEQARLEGLSRLSRWRYIVLPVIRYALGFYVAFRIIDWLRKVDSVRALAGAGGPGYASETIGLYVSNLYFRAGSDSSYAAFLTILQIIFLSIAVGLLLSPRLVHLTEGD
jgi:multiple sugar transport system permease protein